MGRSDHSTLSSISFPKFILGLEMLRQAIVLLQISSQRIQVIRGGQRGKLHVHLPVQHQHRYMVSLKRLDCCADLLWASVLGGYENVDGGRVLHSECKQDRRRSENQLPRVRSPKDVAVLFMALGIVERGSTHGEIKVSVPAGLSPNRCRQCQDDGCCP